MADMTTTTGTTGDPCCAPERQATCCEPGEKADCCVHSKGCGCAATPHEEPTSGFEPETPSHYHERPQGRPIAR